MVPRPYRYFPEQRLPASVGGLLRARLLKCWNKTASAAPSTYAPIISTISRTDRDTLTRPVVFSADRTLFHGKHDLLVQGFPRNRRYEVSRLKMETNSMNCQ